VWLVQNPELSGVYDRERECLSRVVIICGLFSFFFVYYLHTFPILPIKTRMPSFTLIIKKTVELIFKGYYIILECSEE